MAHNLLLSPLFTACLQQALPDSEDSVATSIELNFVEGCNSGPEESGSRLHAIDGARHHVSIDTLYQGVTNVRGRIRVRCPKNSF